MRFIAAIVLAWALCPAVAVADWYATVPNGQTSPAFGDPITACKYSYSAFYPAPPFGGGVFSGSEKPGYNIFGQPSPNVMCDFYVTYFGGVYYHGAATATCPSGTQFSFSAPGGCAPVPQDDPGPPSCPAGNPINIISGNKSETTTDFTTQGAFPFTFTRHYDSQWTAVSRLGVGWRSNFDRYFNSSWGVVRLVLGDGRLALFNQVGSAWQPAYLDTSGGIVSPRADVSWSLVQNASGWVFTDMDGTVENYNSSGQLTSVAYRGGYTQTLAYDGNGNNISVSDSLGRLIQFAYSASGMLSSVTAPDGQVYQYQYVDQSTAAPTDVSSLTTVLSTVTYPATAPATAPQLNYEYENTSSLTALTGITDERGIRFATWTYDANGYATSSQHANGVEHTSIQYNLGGNTRIVTNAAGKQAVYQLATKQGALQRIASIQGQPSASCAGSVKQFGYDSNSFVNHRIDGEGRTTTWTNDSQGHPLSRTDGSGTALARTTGMSWLSSYRVPTQIVKPGLTTNLGYDGAGRLTQRQEVDTTSQTLPYSTNGQTRIWTYGYNAAGLLASVDGPLAGTADTTAYSYDAHGYLSSVTNALGQVTQVTSVNGMGQPLTILDANDVETDLTYDAHGRLIQATANPGAQQAQTQLGYDAAGEVTSITQPNGASYTLEYDDARRLSAIQNGAGERIEYTRNLMGGITTTAIRNSGGGIVKSATATFDELNRLLTQVGAGSQTTTYAYDRTDNVTGVTDPLSHQYAYGYDALNRLISESGPLQYTGSYGYDAQDHQTSVTDPLGHVTTYVYDGFGDVIRRRSPDTGTTDYSYDARGLVQTETSARGVVTSYGYDLLGRITSRSYSTSPAESVTYAYDDTTAGNKGIGRLSLMTDASGGTQYVYNALGQVTQEQRSISGTAYATRYAYDASGQVLSVTYPSGRIVSYQRDSQGRVTSVSTQAAAGAAAVTVASGGSYLPYGPLTGFTYGNGLANSAGYDADYRIASLHTAQGATTVQSLQYGYDADSNITAITDNLTGTRSQTLGYDALNRLTSA
ncbi:MAG: hypothetical protein JWR07_442, partial [Nevskia sp.]|nr:hypothetical protein [Nevskia sp.]